MFEYIYGWDATSDIIENWMYDKIAEHYILDDEVREWMDKANPFAVKEMMDVLLEANSRGMWETTDDMMERLKLAYLNNEEFIEEMADRHP